MINMFDLQKLVKLVLLTGDIKDLKPVSLLVVSKSGNGKTELITTYDKKTAPFFTDISYTALAETLKKDRQIKHIIIPDFIKITQKKRSTSDNLISFLNALLEEGAGHIRLYGQDIDLKKRTIGLITATTKASFGQRNKAWANFGFLQRMLIVSYDYSEETIEKIIDSINEDRYIKTCREKVEKIGRDVKSEKSLNSQLNKYAKRNFRTLKHLQALTKAHALMRNSRVVEQQDVDEIIRLTKYLNLEYTKI